MKKILPGVFRAYDIRGVVGKDFDPEWVQALGRACGKWFNSRSLGPAVVGHDCRHSSPEYAGRLLAGLAEAGVDATFIGMVPTPVFYYAVKKLGRKAGVMITASHNPPEYNGFKIWGGETTIHTTDIQEIYEIMAGQSPAGQTAEPTVISEHDIVPSYLEELASQCSLDKPVKVVVDGGNGAGGKICAELLRRVGADVVELYCEPDGSFPNHHPDPVVEKYVGDLMQKVVDAGADLGVGLDGDADRIGVVDAKGKLMYGDQVLAIFARDVLREHPGATVIGEVKCSHLLYKDIAAHGGDPLMWITGHSMIKAKLAETGAKLAGEMSGHMFFADRFYGFDDGLYAAMRLVEIVSKTQTPLHRMLEDWPTTYNTPEIRMECAEEIKFDVVRKAKEYFAKNYDINDVDGVRITFADGWGLLRASNTQPVLVLRFEAESAERLQELRDVIEKPLQQWIAELQGGA